MISFIIKVSRINKDRLLAYNFGISVNSPGKHNERKNQEMACPHLCYCFLAKPFHYVNKKD